jgi:putative transposase
MIVMQNQNISYKRYRFPPQIIAHVVWLYVRFNLSLREVEELMLERGIDVSYETIRRWTIKFGPLIAHILRRRQPRPGDVWHLDEVVVKIAGLSFWLWRAVDQHGVVLEEILQPRRDKRAAKRLLIKLMKRWGFLPKRIITDKLRSYGAAKREVAPSLDHWSHKGLNNRAENSHLPFRKRERVMQGFRSPGGLQRFVSMQSATRNRFSVPARRRSALTIRYHRLEALESWKPAAYAA